MPKPARHSARAVPAAPNLTSCPYKGTMHGMRAFPTVQTCMAQCTGSAIRLELDSAVRVLENRLSCSGQMALAVLNAVRV